MNYIQQLLLLCPLVFLAGFIDSIAGGGGLISLSAYLLVGLPAHMAIGTNKLSAIFGSLTSSFRFIKSKSHFKKSLVASIISALIGSALGAQLALLVDEKILRIFLLVAVPVLAIFIALKKDFDDPVDEKNLSDFKIILYCSVITFLGGAYDGFFGPGAGTFLIIAHIFFANLSLREAMANSKIANTAMGIAAFTVYMLNGKIAFSLGLLAAVFAMGGNYLGTGLAIKNGKKIVRPIMLLVLAMLIIKLVMDMV